MRDYEVMWVVAPTETDEAVAALVKHYEEMLVGLGAELVKTEVWGRRKLAYTVKKFREGTYILFVLKSPPEPIKELERRFKMTEAVIRFMTVRLDLETRRAVKLAAIRPVRRPPENAMDDDDMGDGDMDRRPPRRRSAMADGDEPGSERERDDR